MLVDLHVHSTASDGTLSPSETIVHAKEKGLEAIALTDHDTVNGLEEAIQAGKLYKVEVIPGIELSADFPNDNLHILGYCIDYKNETFLEKLKPILNAREIRNDQMIENLSEIGLDITIEEDVNVVTRAHFAHALYEAGHVATFQDAFEDYLSPGKPGYVKRVTPSPKECIEIIHNSGGLAFLAHPTLYGLNTAQLTKLVKELKGYGLDGLEAIHSVHNQQDETFLRVLASKNHMLISGGSDFHGDNKPNLELATGYGNLKIPYRILENIKNKAEMKND